MRPRIAPGAAIALAALAVGRFIDRPSTLSPKVFGVDSKAPPQFSPPEFGPALGAGDDIDPNKYADQALWNKYLKKGDHMMCLMEATDRGAGWLMKDTRQPPSAASKWTGNLEAERQTWYWHEKHFDKGWECDWAAQGLKPTFEGLGLGWKPKYSDEGDLLDGTNDCFVIEHYDANMPKDPDDPWGAMLPVREQKYVVGGKTYRATAAFYNFAVNYDGGLIAQNIESPSHAVVGNMGWGRPANPGELPDLQFASDIFWGFWVRDNPNIKNFRIYGAHHVINKDTTLLVSRAFKNLGLTRSLRWPGIVFSAGTEEFRALIGSPIGATAAHFLTTHKAELGIKRITKVTVVTNEGTQRKGRTLFQDMHIFYTVEDVPEDKVTKPDEDAVAKRETGRIDSKVISIRDGGKNMIRVHTMMG